MSPFDGVTVLGVGNVLMGDDGVGVRVVERLREEGHLPGAALVDGGTAVFDVLVSARGGRKLIVIDAVDGGGEPGALYRVPLEELGPVASSHLSLHEVSLVESLTLLELGGTRWDEVVIIGVEPAAVGWSTDLSPQVSGAVGRIMELVEREAASNGRLQEH